MRSDPNGRDALSDVNEYEDNANHSNHPDEQLPSHLNVNANSSKHETDQTVIQTESSPAQPNNHSPQLPTEERTFGIRHIIELVFSLLDNETLLKCRLVSDRWSYFASEQLLARHLSLAFKEYPKSTSTTTTTTTSQVTYFVLCQNESNSLEKLSVLLETSTNFPIASFEFRKIDCRRILHHSEFFFNCYGRFIKKIKINGPLHFKDLKTLLFSQAPNLEELELELTSHYRGGKFNVYYEFPQENSILNKKKKQHSTLKLQVLKHSQFLAPKYLEEILQVSSPNIQRVENNLN